jgi:hypothetical protein
MFAEHGVTAGGSGVDPEIQGFRPNKDNIAFRFRSLMGEFDSLDRFASARNIGRRQRPRGLPGFPICR